MNTENLTKKFAKSATGRLLANKMTDIMGEGFEEAASEVIQPFVRRAVYDKNAANASASDILTAAGNGALVSAILGAVDMGSNIARYNKNKQDTVYTAYTTELDRQIHQEMAKQSANSRNNKISAGSPHNIEKTSENNYNVNKEGDIYGKETSQGYATRGINRVRTQFGDNAGRIGVQGNGEGVPETWNRRRFRNISDESSARQRYERIVNSPEFYAKDINGSPIILYHGTNADFDEFKPSATDIGIHLGNIEQAKEARARKNGHRIIATKADFKNPIYVGVDDFGSQSTEGYFDLIFKSSDLSDADIEYIKSHSGQLYALREMLHKEIQKPSPEVKTITDILDKLEELEKEKNATSVEEWSAKLNRGLEADLKTLGYDGIVYPNDSEGAGLSYIAFNPKQIVIVDDGRQTNKNTMGTSVKESDTIPETPANVNTAPGSYYPQPATPAKTKQATVYTAYATELDRQIHQEMAKQSANSRNNKISANSLHNIEKTSENNYNVNKEGDNYGDKLADLQQRGTESVSARNEEAISNPGRGRNLVYNSDSQTQGYGSGKSDSYGSRKDTARINGTEITYTNVPKSKANENAKTMCAELKKFGLDSIVFSGDAIGNDGKEADTLLDTECASFGGGKILVGNNFNLHPIENDCHEAFHEYYRMNNQAAVDFNKTGHNNYIKDSKSAKSLEKTLVKFGYKKENFHNEIPAYVSGWIYSTHYGNEDSTNNVILKRYSKAFENFSEILKRHETFVNSIRKDTKDI